MASAAAVLPPGQDPFYSPPTGYASAAPGDILRWRKVENSLKNLTGYEDVFQILYRTTDSNGNPQADTTTVIIPKNADMTKLVSYQIFEDSSAAQCEPSYALQVTGTNGDTSLQEILDKGWVLNTPDYEGTNNSYTAGILAGQSTLDSVRAVLKSQNFTNIDTDPKLALWGYSGGSIASGWAAQLQPHYAPELRIDGVAVGGYCVNLTAIVLSINNGLYAGFVPPGIMGLGSQYPVINQVIKDNIFPNNASEFYAALDMCMEADLLKYAFVDIFSYFKIGEGILTQPGVPEILANLTMGATPPKAPMYVYQGMQDEIAPVSQADETISKYCKEGGDDVSISYFKDPDTDHHSEFSAGQPYALAWIDQILSGSKPASGCRTVTTAFAAINATSSATATVPANGTIASSSASATPTGSAINSASTAPSGTAAPGSSSNATLSASQTQTGVQTGSGPQLSPSIAAMVLGATIVTLQFLF